MRNKVLLILVVLVLMASVAAAPALAEPVEKAVSAEEAMSAEEVAPGSEEAVQAEKTIPDEEAVPAEEVATEFKAVSNEEAVPVEKATTEASQALLPEGLKCEPSYTSPDSSMSTMDCVLRPAHDDEDEQDGNVEEDPETWISIHCVPGSEFIKGNDPSGREDTCLPKDEEAVPVEKATTEASQALLPEGLECEPSYTSPDGSISTNDCVLRPAHDEDEQGDNGVVRGCPEDYYYDEDLGRCSPDHLLFGELAEMPDSLGEAVGWLGILPADSLKSLGLGTWGLLDYAVGDTLSDWGEEIGGPLGYGLKGLGGIFSFTGTVGGGLLESAGHFVDDLSDGVGGVIDDLGEGAEEWADDVGDAAEDVWDGITGGWW